MDQVRTLLKTIWEQRFWVLSSLGTLAVLICWYMATGDLNDQFATRKRAIQGMFQAMNTLNNQQLHPNENVIEGNASETSKEGASTLKKWQELYNYQSEEVLFWPKDHLEADFIEEINQLKFGDNFPPLKSQGMRGNYWNYIENRFDGLIEIVQVLKLETSVGSAGRGGGFGGNFGGAEFGGGEFGGGYAPRGAGGVLATEQEDYLVQWLDQGALQAQLHFEKKPTALEIWVTQEDLWVYETLLNVIANTNKAKGATRPDNTAVRLIMELQVGRKAIEGGKQQGNILQPLSEGSSSAGAGFGRGEEFGGGGYGGEFGGGGGFDGGGYGGGYGGEFGGGEFGADGPASDSQILAFRYLDTATGSPLEGDLSNLNSEFRQLPVRMVLKMDQGWIPHVLVECANAALPVEVKKIRINPMQSGEGFGSSSSFGGARRNTAQGMQPIAEDESLVEIEIQGAVYIYNAPDKTKLGIPGEEVEQDQYANVTQ